MTKSAANGYQSTVLRVFLTCVNTEMQFLKLFGVKNRRCIKHNVASAVVLREGYAVAYRVETSHD